MHIGCGDKPSKTECVFFPPSGFFDYHMLFLPAPSNNEIDNAIGYNNDALIDKECNENKERSCRTRKEELYDQLKETQPI